MTMCSPGGVCNVQQWTPSAYEVELQAIEDYRNFAATTIQRFYQGWIVRLHRSREEAATREQQQAAASQQAEAARLYKAARTIQDSWRSYRNRRIYCFYRDLIKFREAADPRQLLRCINAHEAALVDPAAGLHIRFRLGGSSMPPILLYKVFTHRPVTDICAFGPRDYAAEATASKPTAAAVTVAAKPSATAQGASALHCSPSHHSSSSSGGVSSSSSSGRQGWYCRDDRNGWRPVVELQRQLEQQQQPAWASSSCRSMHHWRMPRRRGRGVRLACGVGEGSRRSGKDCNTAQAEAAGAEPSGYCSEPEVQGSCQRSKHYPGKKQYYHYSPVVRRAERALQLKHRRRQWLLKMYRTGMGVASGNSITTQAATTTTAAAAGGDAVMDQASTDARLGLDARGRSVQQSQQQPTKCERCSSEEQLLQQLERELMLAAAGSSNSAGDDNAGPHPTSSTDVDELLTLGLDAGILTWAQKLDFDSYQQQWSSTAVSLGSECAVVQSERQQAVLQQVHWEGVS